MNALVHIAGLLKDRLLKTPLERDLTEAMNNEKWGCSNTLLRAISDRSFGVTNAGVIMNAIWENLRASGKEWRRLYKTLVLLEYLLKHGSARCVHETQDEKFKIRIL
jgi:epsin